MTDTRPEPGTEASASPEAVTTPVTTAGPAKPRRTKRRFIWLAILVFLVVGLWSGYWTVVRGMAQDLLHNATAVARAEGREIACGDEGLGGFPFQFALSCAPLRLADTDGRSLAADGFRAVALAYNPRHLILEADAPLVLTPPTGARQASLIASWQLAQASLRLEGEGLARADMALTAPQILFGTGRDDPAPLSLLAAQQASLHLRASPDASGDADIAVSGSDVTLATLPSPLALSLTARVSGGEALMQGRADPAAVLSRPDALKVSALRVAGEGFALSASGSLSLDEKGRLQGDLPLTVSGADKLPAVLAPLFPQGSNGPVALAGAILAFGRPGELDGKPAVIVPLAFRDGVARVGLIPIAPLTPLL